MVKYGSYCAAIDCNNYRKKCPGLPFFRFPRDPERCKQWVRNCRRADFQEREAVYLNRNCFICASHFTDDQFMNTERKRLVWSAVPTLFEFPDLSHLGVRRSKRILGLDSSAAPKLVGEGRRLKVLADAEPVVPVHNNRKRRKVTVDEPDVGQEIDIGESDSEDELSVGPLMEYQSEDRASPEEEEEESSSSDEKPELNENTDPLVSMEFVPTPLYVSGQDTSVFPTTHTGSRLSLICGYPEDAVTDVHQGSILDHQYYARTPVSPTPSPLLERVTVEPILDHSDYTRVPLLLPKPDASGVKSECHFLADVSRLGQMAVDPASDHCDYARCPVRSPNEDAASPSSVVKKSPLSVESILARKNLVTRKLRSERVKVSRLKKKVATLQRQVNLESKANTNSVSFIVQVASRYLAPDALRFFETQLKLAAYKKQGYRWTEYDKRIALKLFNASPTAYKVLRGIFSLPSRQTLRRSAAELNIPCYFFGERTRLQNSRDGDASSNADDAESPTPDHLQEVIAAVGSVAVEDSELSDNSCDEQACVFDTRVQIQDDLVEVEEFPPAAKNSQSSSVVEIPSDVEIRVAERIVEPDQEQCDEPLGALRSIVPIDGDVSNVVEVISGMHYVTFNGQQYVMI